MRTEMLSFSQRRTMLDQHGNIIAHLRHKKMNLVPTIYIGTPANEKKVVLKSSGLLNDDCNASITIDGEKVGKVEGDSRAEKFSIRIDGEEIATIRRKRKGACAGRCRFLQHQRKSTGTIRGSCLRFTYHRCD